MNLQYREPSFFLILLGMIPSAYYIFNSGSRKSILLTNILALSFAHDAMSMLKADSFQTGSILLSGLFFYDVWWVFGTKVVREQPSFLAPDVWRQMTEL
jgi:minor histocompatibility antigen H13